MVQRGGFRSKNQGSEADVRGGHEACAMEGKEAMLRIEKLACTQVQLSQGLGYPQGPG